LHSTIASSLGRIMSSKVSLAPLVQRVLMTKSLKMDGCTLLLYIRTNSCHHIQTRKSTFFQFLKCQHFFSFLSVKYVHWMFTVIIGCLVFTAAMSGIIGGWCYCDNCSWWVMIGVHLLYYTSAYLSPSGIVKLICFLFVPLKFWGKQNKTMNDHG
jgi:hypothetical protein